MKIVLVLPDFDNREEHDEAVEYVNSLKDAIERKLWQGFPGLMLERGDASIWVKDVRIQLDNVAETT